MKSAAVILTSLLLFGGVLGRPSVVLASPDTCQAMDQEISSCGFLNLSSTGDQIYLNQPVVISGVINPLAQSEACGTQDAHDPQLKITGPNGNVVLDETYQVSSGVNASFTPDRLGDYTLRFYLDTTSVYGGGSLFGGSYEAGRFNLECQRTFRVCLPDDDQCNSLNPSGETGNYDICTSNLSADSEALAACTACYSSEGIWTAIGCISQDPRDLVGKLINTAIGISGGVALIIILISGFSLTLSQGDVKKTSDAKEWLTAAVVGLIFIILSVTMLEFIGNTVLRIPGFGG